MAIYDGFFDAVLDDETGEYDRAYESGDFTGYFEKIIGSGVCVHGNENSFKVRLENGKAVVSPGCLFIQGYWCKNDADYSIDLPGTGSYAIVAHLNLGQRMIELEARSVSQAYPDSLVLAIVSPSSAEDTRHNTDICGVIDTAGALSSKVEWALNYIDTEIESKLAQVEQDIAAQSAKLDKKIAEVQAVADSIVPPPIGSIKFSASQNVGPEWLKCDGSFVNEAQYPELVESLGKLIPSGDKFQIISSGEIGPQISNGVIYDGKMWVYSYSTKKLYGVDLAGTADIKEIPVTSEDVGFSRAVSPTSAMPIALSITASSNGTAKLFLAQILTTGSIVSTGSGWKDILWLYSADFDPSANSISMSAPFETLTAEAPYQYLSSRSCVPYVVCVPRNGTDRYFLAASTGYSITDFYCYICWAGGEDASILSYGVNGTTLTGLSRGYRAGQRVAYSKKSKYELVDICAYSGRQTGSSTQMVYYTWIKSAENEVFSRNTSTDRYGDEVLTVPTPLSVAGNDKILFEMSKTEAITISTGKIDVPQKVSFGLSTPPGSRVFVDAGAYLWGKDIYLIFVGTGIIFSRTLETGSFGYLDTTSVLGTITQFGYLDYSQNEGTLYLLGQDTTNTVKVAKIVLNTLYDYANDGAWLPMIASDGVPAYIKAKEAET